MIDTNIIIDSLKYPDEFKVFYDTLRTNEVKSVLDHVIKFEFMRGGRTLQEYKKQEKFLELLFSTNYLELPIKPEIFLIAERIAIFAARLQNKAMKLGDSLIASQLEQYTRSADTLYLATQNHDDFPPFLFERAGIQILTLPDGKIKCIGIYGFNRTAYKQLSN